jgi:hypothetical protein
MKDAPVIFVNSLAVSGFQNGIINLAFNQSQFLPEERNGEMIVTTQDQIVVQLRMDLYCVQQLHTSIGKIIAEQTKPAAKEIN